MSDELRRLPYGESIIEYALSFAPRKTLAVHVHPDLRVTVQAPLGTPLDAVEERIRKRAAWILKQQRELEPFLPHTPPRQYVSGETHRYLGRQYRLKVVESPDAETVKLTRGRLWVHTRDPQDRERVRALVQGWYRTQGERLLPERLGAMLPRFARFELPAPRLTLRWMEARWGSCTESGTVTLNLKLMQVPTPCIDYVIVHELCHLIEHNHGPRFYRLLDTLMPDWRRRREQLNRSHSGFSL